MEVSQGRDERSGHSSSSSTGTAANSAPENPTPPPNQNCHPPLGSPRPAARSEPANTCPTTFVQADASSFKQVVQMLTGSPKPDQTPPSPPPPEQQDKPHHHHSIPPIKTNQKKTGSGFKLYERRNSLKSLMINPLASFPGQPGSLASPHHPEILSPSILDFPALVLSPVTPLAHDPFSRSPRPTYDSPNLDFVAEEKAIREKGFFLHQSPATTPQDAEPRLLPLFPLSSPRVPGSSSSD